MWQMLSTYGVGGKLIKEVQSFSVDSSAHVRVGNDVRDGFPVNVGLRQGCVMSSWLFNEYMDGVVQEVNELALIANQRVLRWFGMWKEWMSTV